MKMSKPGVAHDQTVEEILASIRQVISGDTARRAVAAARSTTGAGPEAPAARKPSVVSPFPVSKIVDSALTPTAAEQDAAREADAEIHDGVERAIAQALQKVDPDEVRAETAPGQKPRPRPEMAVARPRQIPVPERPVMLDPPPRVETAAAEAPEPEQPPQGEQPSRGLLSPRANAAVSASFSDLAREIAARGMRDVDQTVEELLRPMLRTWLDDNLPGMVERLVREEIERVSRGRR